MTERRGSATVLGLAMAMVAISYADRSCIAAAAPFIIAELGITKVQLGLAFTAFSIGYAIFEAPSGRMADRVGARRALRRIVIGWSIMTALTGSATGMLSLIGMRFIFGACEAGTYPSLARLYDDLLLPRQRGRGFGWAMTIATLSGALIQPIALASIGWIGWRATFVVLGAVGGVWAVLWSACHWPQSTASTSPPAPSGDAPIPWRVILSMRDLWFRCLSYASTLYGLYIFQTWFPTYLLSIRGGAPGDVGWLSGLAASGVAVGIIAGGYLNDRAPDQLKARFASRAAALAMFAAAAFVGVAGTATAPLPVVALFVAAGLAAGLPVAYTWTSCAALQPRAVGTACGVLNMFGNLGGALTGISMGLMADRTGSWQMPLFSVAIAFAVASLTWWLSPRRVIESEAQTDHQRHGASYV